MTDRALSVSLRSFLDRWFVAVLVCCLLIAAGGGYLAYGAHAQEETTTEERTVGTWTVESGFEHSAVVQRDATVFEPGDRLENRALYFTTVSPELDWNYTLAHSGSSEPAVASVNATLVVRAIEEREGEEILHWEETTAFDSVESEGLGPDETLTVGGTVDIETLRDRIERIQENLEAAPGQTEVFLRVDTTIEGTVSGEPIEETRQERLELDLGPNVYRVTADVDGATSRDVTESTTVTVDPSPLEAYGSVLLLVLGLLGLVGVSVARWRGLLVVTPEERARHDYETARSDFEEWISRGRLPENSGNTTVHINSLPDLVDVAIDSDRRVIEDDERGCFAVLVDDVVYYYSPPPAVHGDGVDPLRPGDGGVVSPVDVQPSREPTGADEARPGTNGSDGTKDETEDVDGERTEPD